MSTTRTTPVLEIGGTHVTAALVDVAACRTVGPVVRDALPAGGSAEEILGRIAGTADRVAAPDRACWGVAVPGPFDYPRGIGLFQDVGKFEALYGVDIGAGLAGRMRGRPAALRFLNDADAFGVGEHLAGAAAGERRAVCLTLGTGVGSAFLADGVPVNGGPLVPPDGSAHLLTYAGRPLEDTVSRRAIRAVYADATGVAGERVPDVRDIAERARDGDVVARAVLDGAFQALGAAFAPWLARFEATVLVIGGAMAASWDLIEHPLSTGLAAGPEAASGADRVAAHVAANDAARDAGPGAVPSAVPDAALPAVPALRAARRGHDAALLGAARWARRADGGAPEEPGAGRHGEPGERGVGSPGNPGAGRRGEPDVGNRGDPEAGRRAESGAGRRGKSGAGP